MSNNFKTFAILFALFASFAAIMISIVNSNQMIGYKSKAAWTPTGTPPFGTTGSPDGTAGTGALATCAQNCLQSANQCSCVHNYLSNLSLFGMQVDAAMINCYNSCSTNPSQCSCVSQYLQGGETTIPTGVQLTPEQQALYQCVNNCKNNSSQCACMSQYLQQRDIPGLPQDPSERQEAFDCLLACQQNANSCACVHDLLASRQGSGPGGTLPTGLPTPTGGFGGGNPPFSTISPTWVVGTPTGFGGGNGGWGGNFTSITPTWITGVPTGFGGRR